MCLAIPAKILAIEDECATVQVGSLDQTCYLGLVPEAKVGDYVIVHAGYAISILNEEEAQKTLDLFRQLADFQSDENAFH